MKQANNLTKPPEVFGNFWTVCEPLVAKPFDKTQNEGECHEIFIKNKQGSWKVCEKKEKSRNLKQANIAIIQKIVIMPKQEIAFDLSLKNLIHSTMLLLHHKLQRKQKVSNNWSSEIDDEPLLISGRMFRR